MKETVIHVKIGINEALESKKNVLELEMNFLNLLKEIKKYKELKLMEIEKETEMNKMLKKVNLNFGKLNKLLPKVQTPKLKRENSYAIREKTIRPNTSHDPIESQLQDIQERLQHLNQRF